MRDREKRRYFFQIIDAYRKEFVRASEMASAPPEPSAGT